MYLYVTLMRPASYDDTHLPETASIFAARPSDVLFCTRLLLTGSHVTGSEQKFLHPLPFVSSCSVRAQKKHCQIVHLMEHCLSLTVQHLSISLLRSTYGGIN